MLTWLSQRLNMSYVSGPTADPLWGNAILSRYPIIESNSYDLPPRDLFILRGFTSAVIDIGGGDSLQVIATHFHHLDEDSNIRQLQSPVIINYWNKADRTIVLGDLNAEPNAPETEMLYQAGLVDALAEAEPSATYTFHSADLYQRIDYIWVSPDLVIKEASVMFSNASDHLPIIALIDK
jgi:endonuclease/exonuclease/phosphatase family metal-dependent hydrolase